MEKNSKNNVKKISKFILILLFIVLLFVFIFIGYKIYIFNLVNKVYDVYHTFLENDNIHIEAKSTSSAYDGEFVYYELYRKNGKEIITERSRLSNVYECSQMYYRDLSSGDIITQTDMKAWDSILNKEIHQPTTYTVSDGRFGFEYINFLPKIIRELNYIKNDVYDFIYKVNSMKYYLNVNIKDFNDNNCIVLEFAENEIKNTLWIEKESYRIVKNDYNTIFESVDINGNVTQELVNNNIVFTMEENIVKDEDIKWIDLTGKNVTILD